VRKKNVKIQNDDRKNNGQRECYDQDQGVYTLFLLVRKLSQAFWFQKQIQVTASCAVRTVLLPPSVWLWLRGNVAGIGYKKISCLNAVKLSRWRRGVSRFS
jgi:hypothetical protein